MIQDRAQKAAASEFYVYLHCRPDGTPFYVGKGYLRRSRDFKHGRNRHYLDLISKYGIEHIKIYVFDCVSEREAFDIERHWIKQLRSEGYKLVNETDGGEGARGAKRTDETRAKLSMAMKGNTNGIGVKHSPEGKARMLAAHLGRKATPEEKRKMSLSRLGNKNALGHRLSDEARYRCGNGVRGTRHPWGNRMHGKHHSEETKRKIGAAHKGLKMSEASKAKMRASRLAYLEKTRCL